MNLLDIYMKIYQYFISNVKKIDSMLLLLYCHWHINNQSPWLLALYEATTAIQLGRFALRFIHSHNGATGVFWLKCFVGHFRFEAEMQTRVTTSTFAGWKWRNRRQGQTNGRCSLRSRLPLRQDSFKVWKQPLVPKCDGLTHIIAGPHCFVNRTWTSLLFYWGAPGSSWLWHQQQDVDFAREKLF